MKEKFNITKLVNDDGCFDLQFRKDIRHERTNSPTYYRWKAQFIVTAQKEQVNILEKCKKVIGCGNVSTTKNQARYSVQKIDDIIAFIIPFFEKNKLDGNKKKDFELWQKSANIVFKNKGKHLAQWEKNDLLKLIEIHKSSAKYKNNPRAPKWIEIAQTFTKNI